MRWNLQCCDNLMQCNCPNNIINVLFQYFTCITWNIFFETQLKYLDPRIDDRHQVEGRTEVCKWLKICLVGLNDFSKNKNLTFCSKSKFLNVMLRWKYILKSMRKFKFHRRHGASTSCLVLCPANQQPIDLCSSFVN